AAAHGPVPEREAVEEGLPIVPETVSGCAVIDRKTVHVPDLAGTTDFPVSRGYVERYGTRTMLSTPLLREGVPIGVIHMRRREARPFTDRQIALLESFADQAVIAIENARLFAELQERLAEQTATAEVLRVISESPTEPAAVFDAIARSALRVVG